MSKLRCQDNPPSASEQEAWEVKSFIADQINEFYIGGGQRISVTSDTKTRLLTDIPDKNLNILGSCSRNDTLPCSIMTQILYLIVLEIVCIDVTALGIKCAGGE